MREVSSYTNGIISTGRTTDQMLIRDLTQFMLSPCRSIYRLNGNASLTIISHIKIDWIDIEGAVGLLAECSNPANLFQLFKLLMIFGCSLIL